MKNFFSISLIISSLTISWLTTNPFSAIETNFKSSSNEDLVEAAILDYVEGIYEVAPKRIEKSVSTELRKRGFWLNEEKKEYVDNLDMSYEELLDLASSWNKDGSRADENSPKEIQLFEVNDKTASAKLKAVWGVDYFHLAKTDDQWKIVNVIWQSLP